MAKQKGMSFIEKAGLFFGVVGVLADFTALVSFTYGFASLEQFTPSHISSDSATSFFKWFSGLMIIYAWLIASWYFTRRSFVLRYEKPKGYKNPLDSRSQRTIFGIALSLFPIFIYWSIVNISISAPVGKDSMNIQQQVEILTPTIEASVESLTSTPTVNATETIGMTVEPTIIDSSTLVPEATQIILSPTAIVTPTPTYLLPRPSPESEIVFLGILYYAIGLPFIMYIFGLVIYACINSLMPIVHVELLDDYE